jgi:hypothetical protein
VESRERLVAKIDHVFVPLVDAAAGFCFLTETLGLPVAWPFAEYGPFASGGVSLGNANFEVLRSQGEIPVLTARTPARVQGIAFEPAVPADAALLIALDRRRISHGPLIPFEGEGHGTSGLLWTNVFVWGLVDDEHTVGFVCDYRIPEVRDLAARCAALAHAGGGRLGVEDFVEVVVGARDPMTAAARWQCLVDPLAPVSPGRWRFPAGPALRIERADEDAVSRVVLAVRSLSRAEEALRALGVGVGRMDDGLRVAAPPLGGLDVRLASA